MFHWQAGDQFAVPGRAKHLLVNREVAAHLCGSPGFGNRTREPVQDNFSSIGQERTFKVPEHFADCADTMNAQDLVTVFSACLQNTREYPFLDFEATVKTRSGIQADLSDITSIWQIAFE
ncbi:hypothetical protein BGV46_15870 [Serratia marcescens]|nr:hypothetical protein RN42_02095 [Serratia marcescens]OHT33289.1 hypothetical protein BGV45_14880 [Serratia marcescens]OHT33851.1 hypothetical protein BGV46_15870 [Serratia marcescens]